MAKIERIFQSSIRITLATLILLQFLLNSARSDDSKVYEFQQLDLQNVDNFRNAVFQFTDGDQVKIFFDQTVILDIRLKKFLGEGSYGRVFLIDDATDSKVIKFQYGSEKAREMMASEAVALSKLAHKNVSHSRVLENNSLFYLIKEYVPGDTLATMVSSTWYGLEPEGQRRVIKRLSRLKRSLKNSRLLFSDLNQENVMFDTDRLDWKITDPGQVLSEAESGEDTSWMLEDALSENPEMVLTYKWANKNRRYQVCIEPFLTINKTLILIKEGELEEARNLYFEQVERGFSELLNRCPNEFKKRWKKLSRKFRLKS